MLPGLPPGLLEGNEYMVKTPAVEIRPMPPRPRLPPLYAANHSAPSGPVVMPMGPESALVPVGNGYGVTTPVGLILSMLLLTLRVSHNAPSGPAAMSELDSPPGNTLAVPVVVIRPTWLAAV